MQMLRMDNKQTYDNHVDASTNTIKYLNGPHVWLDKSLNIPLNPLEKFKRGRK